VDIPSLNGINGTPFDLQRVFPRVANLYLSLTPGRLPFEVDLLLAPRGASFLTLPLFINH
jgi:hypothetical protein